MGRSLDAVVFDLDETLAVTTRERQALLDDATEAVGADPLDRAAYLDAHRSLDDIDTRVPIFERLLPEDTDVTAAELTAAYREAIAASIEPLPGAAEVVRDLGERYAVGLLTDGPRVAQQDKIDQLGWADLFDAVVITGTLPASKPAPVAFETVARELDIDPRNAVYIGDRPDIDIAGARDVGFRTIQVLYDGGPDPNPGADATVDRTALAQRLPSVVDSLDPADED